ncbi:MAG: ABC transporter substrate-binding protein, partial [Oscillospiraceae bacterium]|nr:ABC transporter substrate-binding protein [Oscillospiraceae bacterium]
MKKRLFALVLALAMTVALCACGGDKPSDQTADPTNTGSTGEKLTGGELTVGIAADLDTSLDPHVSSSSAGTREVLFNIYEGLMKPDTEGNLIPAVAESCTVNETADVYTYTLREGVKFHNGADVTVGDVVYSLTRAAGLETGEPLVGEVKGIASVEATDDRTVVVTLKAPDAEFNAYMSVAIIPQGIDPNDSPVGTGPFRFVSHTAQDSVVLEKFDAYWGQGAYLDKVTLKVIPDPQTMVMSVRSGAIDLACHLDATQVANMTDLTIMEGSSNVIQALYLNHDFAPFADERVRQALCYAVDKQAVIDLAMD